VLNFRLIFIATVLFFSACRKDETVFTPYAPSLGEIDYFFLGTLDKDATTIFDLKGGVVIPDTILTTSVGVRIFLANTEQLLVNTQGQSHPMSQCQQIKIEVVQVLDKGDWMARLLPTNTADGKVVDHTGAIRLRIVCDGQEMGIAPDRYIKIQIPAAALNGNMSLNYLTDTNSGWEEGESNSVYWAEWSGQSPVTPVSGYELLTHQTGWITASRVLESVSYSNYCVSLPFQFDAGNTRVFLLFDDTQTIAEMKSDGDPSRFCLAQTPLGYSVRVITLSKAGPTYWLGNEKTETASDATFKLSPIEKTETQISAFIKGL
jgi:hypothetical protein